MDRILEKEDDSMNYKDKKALITGASRGIGRALAKELALCGCEVFVNYAGNDKKAEETKGKIENAGGRCTLARVNLEEADCAEKLFEITGGVDILILNASIQFRNRWTDITAKEFERQINCNLRAPMFLMQKYIPGMINKGWGRVVTIGSVQEAKPHADMLVYSAAKSALTSMAKSVALQTAGTGVTVNSVAPGVIYTDRNVDALADSAYAETVKSKIPMGNWGEPKDCCAIVKTLCSDGAAYITGQNIFVDGGMGIK